MRFGFFNYLQHPIAYACNLAKLGKQEEAASILDESAARGMYSGQQLEALWETLRALARGSKSDLRP